jgi:hypothetical protein
MDKFARNYTYKSNQESVMGYTNKTGKLSVSKKCLVLVTAALNFGLLGQSVSFSGYELSWYTIDGGGGQSSGGQYVLTGTIGQPDAAYSAGGNYELLGGFWPGGPLCIVNFYDFARLTDVWLESGTGLTGDIDKDGDVDMEDLRRLADYWLACCPYKWPLR